LKWWGVSVPELTQTVSVRAHRTLYKSLTAGICSAISAMPFEPSLIVNMLPFGGLPSNSP
jgi:hypothetical protein